MMILRCKTREKAGDQKIKAQRTYAILATPPTSERGNGSISLFHHPLPPCCECLIQSVKTDH